MSGTGPNFDKSNATLVVEHIPEDKLDETSIKDFFGTFGTVTEVNVQSYKKLATVKFERWDMAKKAYDSPAPIFDNRFVKVFWFKPDPNRATPVAASPSAGGRVKAQSPPPQLSKLADEGDIDMEDFKRKSEEAQKAHEAKMARKKVHEEALKELERKKEELLKMEQEQKRILMEKLAKRKAVSGAAVSPPPGAAATTEAPNGSSTTPAQTPPPGQTAASTTTTTSTTTAAAAAPSADTETVALRAQLEALEEEAKFLGIDQASETGSFRGRGSFRSRATTFRGAGLGRGVVRGGGYTSAYVPPGAGKPYVTGYRGRGGAVPVWGRGGATMKLDNRPKKVAVGGVDGIGGGERNEALRQYLLVSTLLLSFT